MVGRYHELQGGDGTGLFGDSNTGSLLSNSLVSGQSNMVSGYNLLVTGNANSVDGNSSLVVGQLNSTSSHANGIVSGVNNFGVGFSFAFGNGLIACAAPGSPWQRPLVVIGQYNVAPQDEQIFAIGNGYSSGEGQNVTITRANAFEVYSNGQIKIPTVQGDISMGEFAS